MKFSEELFASQMRPITGSAIREIFHLLGKPGMISFAGGNPAASALEPDVVSDIAVEVLGKYGTNLLQYGATEGFKPLLETIAEFVKTAGVEATPAQVLPTQGSQQALDLLLKALIDPGDVILVESPTFLGALQTMRTYRAKLVAIPTDEHGVILEAAEEAMKTYHPKLMYVIPTFQNPTGKTLSADRRKPLCELAAKYGVVIAEDDPYRDLRYSGEALPSVKSYDEEDWIVYMGSFSKLIAPGLRVGSAVVTNEKLMRKMIIGKQSTDVHSPLLNQAIVDGYLRRGLMPGHLQTICANYKRQLDAMLKKFDEFPMGVTHTVPEGGLFVWAELPKGMNALELLKEATARNVAYVPGTHFFFDGGRENTLRLNFSNSELPQIEKGMTALCEVVANAMNK